MFVSQFDFSKGYTLVWKRATDAHKHVSFEGLEYKALPSGIQEFDANTVLLAHRTDASTYYGVSRFRQVNNNNAGESDRAKIKMYAVGVLVKDKSDEWEPNNYLKVGWEYITGLDDALKTFLAADDLTVFDKLFAKVTGQALLIPGEPSLALEHHPLSQLPKLFSTLGPLVFPLYKLALIKKSVFLFDNIKAGQTHVDFFALGCFTALVSLLLLVPKDLPQYTKSPSPVPLYQVGLIDLESLLLGESGVVASTNDEVLRYQHQFDYAVVLQGDDGGLPYLVTHDDLNNNPSSHIRATFKDYKKFKAIYRKLEKVVPPETSSDDLASVTTSASILSNIRYGYPFVSDNRYENEPAWWLTHATSPVSWREYIWLAFAWFASAGGAGGAGTGAGASAGRDDGDDVSVPTHDSKTTLTQMVGIIGHFHQLTKKWFLVVQDIVNEELRTSDDSPVSIELTYHDITDMELDPYSHQDLAFVREFILLYWKDKVEHVHIGIGFLLCH